MQTVVDVHKAMGMLRCGVRAVLATNESKLVRVFETGFVFLMWHESDLAQLDKNFKAS